MNFIAIVSVGFSFYFNLLHILLKLSSLLLYPYRYNISVQGIIYIPL